MHLNELVAIITACIAMTLFKTESRNHYNQKREDLQFKKNYKKLFGFAMPHGDTVHNVVERLDGKQLEKLKQVMVRTRKYFIEWTTRRAKSSVFFAGLTRLTIKVTT